MRPTIDHLAAGLNLFVLLGVVFLLMIVASVALGVGPIGSWLSHVGGWAWSATQAS